MNSGRTYLNTAKFYWNWAKICSVIIDNNNNNNFEEGPYILGANSSPDVQRRVNEILNRK